MKNLHLLSHLFFFIIFTTVIFSSAYIPDDNIALDCGFSGLRTTPNGRQWNGDVASKFSPADPPDGNRSTTATVPTNSINDVLYKTARLSLSRFTYTFPVTPGPKFLRLYFLPETYGAFVRPNAFFTVQTGRFTLLRNFSAALNADASSQRVVAREFCVNVGETQKLDVTFIPSPNCFAFVNGIEVVSMPATLYYSVGVGNDAALELYHRLNIGGDEIPPGDDSGMYRRWAVNEFFINSGIFIPFFNYSFPINYTAATPNYTATDAIYQSAVSMGKNQTYNTLRNLTWNLPVHGGFNYLVRLHFCQFPADPFEANENQRNFTVYINKKKMENGTVELVALGSPVYKDYVVMADEKTPNISVDLDPLPSVTFDAILNGIEVFKLSKNGSLAVANPPGTASPPTVASSAKTSNVTAIIAAVVSSVGFAVVFSLVGFVVLWKMSKKKRKTKKKKTAGDSVLPDKRCRSFTFEEILEATDYFNKKREIGVGGFGSVYKGIFEDENLTVAIKRLNPDSRQGEQEFKTEIELLSDLRHSNLVSLVGYCMEGKEMLLVYEFMENGTFKDHLYDTTNTPLRWKKRLEICYGAARGLNYLHTGVDDTIIHRDVKTTNILLDKDMVAKVSDFGMSRLTPNDTAISTAVRGTPGYLDPEYFRRFQVTEKADVYSFGVVLFEVLCARKPLDPTRGDQQFKMTLWAQRCIEDGAAHQIIDPNIKGQISPECLKQFLELATSCIADKLKDRPTMAVVEEKLRFMMKLQEEADAKEMEKNPGGEISYPDELYSELPSMVASMRSESYKSHVANVLSGTDFTSSTVLSDDPFRSFESSGNGGGPDLVKP